MEKKKPVYASTSTEKIINEVATMQQFYCLTNALSNTKHVRFVEKNDLIDQIEWRFTYKRKPLTLQYNIYNGVTIYAEDASHTETVKHLLNVLQSNRTNAPCL